MDFWHLLKAGLCPSIPIKLDNRVHLSLMYMKADGKFVNQRPRSQPLQTSSKDYATAECLLFLERLNSVMEEHLYIPYNAFAVKADIEATPGVCQVCAMDVNDLLNDGSLSRFPEQCHSQIILKGVDCWAVS
jgi:hypothetical protein